MNKRFLGADCEDMLSKQEPFVYRTRVMLEDIHFGETVYHVSYIRMMDRARAEWLMSVGSSNSQMNRDGKFLAISRMSVFFATPAMLEQDLVVESRIHSPSGTGFTFRHEIKGSDGTLFCKADYKMVAVSLSPSGDSFKPCSLKIALPSICSATEKWIGPK